MGRLLVDRLKQETKSLEGIGLYCRRDYDVTHIWSKFGFEAVNSKTGRGKDGAELTFWWFSHGHADLFSRVSEPDPVRQRVVIDANVFFDIHFRDTAESEDSKALFADWVQASIELVVTKELRNEIAKGEDEEQRRASRTEATRYMTERFKKPVGMDTLESLGIRGPFMSPRKINDSQFAAIYRKGCDIT